MNRFIAIDVETANSDYASICQAGMAIFENGSLTGTWESYVDPEDYFEGINVSIHGIDETKVVGAPKIPDILQAINRKFPGEIFVHHTAFDRLSFDKAARKHNEQPLNVRWLDSARVVRRVWEQFRYSGYGLANLAQHFDINFKCHDALEDARTAGEITCRAIKDSGHSVEEWLDLSHSKISPSRIDVEGNPEGLFFGETLVFTGALSMPRIKAAAFAAESGCTVLDDVTAKTTILVVGAQDLRKLAGNEKSSKQRKAEKFIAQGQSIKMLTESDFMDMIKKY